jgi:hypothetical protein
MLKNFEKARATVTIHNRIHNGRRNDEQTQTADAAKLLQ